MKKPLLAFSTLGCPEWSIPEVFSRARRFGMNAVELRGVTGEHISPDSPEADVRLVQEESRRHGIKILSVTAYTTFADEEAEKRAENEQTLLRFVRLAERLGADFVRTFSYEPRHGEADAAGRGRIYDRMAASLNRVAEAIAESPVRILIETHGRMTTGRLMAPLLERIPSGRIGVLWDFPNGLMGGESLEETWSLFGSRVGYMHFKDERKGEDGKVENCHVGEGFVPIRETVEFLRRIGYDGYCCLEWERKWHPEMPPLEEALPIYRDYMTSI